MNRLGHTAFACLLSTFAFSAEPNWQQVARDAEHTRTLSVDVNNVKVRDGRITAWTRYDFTVAQQAMDYPSRQYLSTQGLLSYDCAAESISIVSISYFSQNNGGGEVVDTLDPQNATVHYLRPGSVAYAALEEVCRIAKRGSRAKSPAKATQAPMARVQPQLSSNQ